MSVDEILKHDHSNESFWTVLSCARLLIFLCANVVPLCSYEWNLEVWPHKCKQWRITFSSCHFPVDLRRKLLVEIKMCLFLHSVKVSSCRTRYIRTANLHETLLEFLGQRGCVPVVNTSINSEEVKTAVLFIFSIRRVGRKISQLRQDFIRKLLCSCRLSI